MLTPHLLSQFHYLIRALLWLAVVGLAVVLGSAVMDQIKP